MTQELSSDPTIQASTGADLSISIDHIRKLGWAFWTIAAALFLIVNTFLTLFIAPSFDEFCRATLTPTLDAALENSEFFYYNWSGRWLVHIIYPLWFPNIDLYSADLKYVIALSLPIWLAAFYLLLDMVFSGALSRTKKLLGAAILTMLYWSGMPGPGETWYWLTGSVEYQFPFLLAMISMWFCARLYRTQSVIVSMACLLLSGVAALCVSGLNELVGVLLCGVMLTAAGVALLTGNYKKSALGILLVIIAAAGVLISVSAPGNAVRASQFPNASSLFHGIVGVVRPDRSPLEYISDPRLIIAMIWILSSRTLAAAVPDWLGSSTMKTGPSWLRFLFEPRIWIPLVTIAGVSAAAFLVNYATGAVQPQRVFNMLYGFFLIGAILTALAWSSHVESHRQGFEKVFDRLHLGAFVLLPVLFLASPNFLYAVEDVALAPSWHNAIVERYEMASNSGQSGTILVDPITQRPPTHQFWEDINTDSDHWLNGCRARYFGVDKLQLAVDP